MNASHTRFSPSEEAEPTPQGGFGVIELLIAVFVLALVMTGFAAVMFSATRANVVSENRTRAQQIATSEIEGLRAMRFEDLGLVAGNPPGTVVAEKTVDGFKVNTDVYYVDDRVPGTYQTYKDYKGARVTVTDPVSKKVVATFDTQIAPPSAPGQNESVIKVQVVDALVNEPISNVDVKLAGGPSSTRNDTSDAAGYVIFPGLVPNSNQGTTNPYDITTTEPGYVTLPQDLPPSLAARVRVAPTTVLPTVIRMYKPVTLRVNLFDEGGSAFTQSSTVTIAGDSLLGAVTATGGTVATSTAGGSQLVPDQIYKVDAYRTSGGTQGWFAQKAELTMTPDYPTSVLSVVNLTMKQYDLGRIQVIVKNPSNNPIAGARIVVSGGPGDVYFVGTTNSGGIVDFDVPKDSSSAYQVALVAQSGVYTGVQINSPAPQGATTVVNITAAP